MDGFLERAEEAADKIIDCSQGTDLSLVSHWDADGVAAAATLSLSLSAKNISFKVKFVDSLTEEVIESMAKGGLPSVFIDIGSGSLDSIGGKLSGRTVVLDHHQPQGSGEGVLQLNPCLYGFDGGKDLSASGTAFFVASSINREPEQLPVLGIVGALADLQDKNEMRELRGLNALVVNEGEERGIVKVEEDLIFFGRETRPLMRALAGTFSFQIPGVTGDEAGAFKLLDSLQIDMKEHDMSRTISDLKKEEKQRLTAGLLQILVDRGMQLPSDLPFVGKAYTFIREDKWSPTRDAREFSFLLNSLGRSNRFDLGMSLAMGYRGELLEQSIQVSQEYTSSIQTSIRSVLTVPGAITETEKLVIVRGEDLIDPNILSPVATILSTGTLFRPNKLFVAVALEDDVNVKVSSRASYELATSGVNAGKIMELAAKAVGGQGGGHNVAAGATIPRRRVERFLERVGKLASEGITPNQSEDRDST